MFIVYNRYTLFCTRTKQKHWTSVSWVSIGKRNSFFQIEKNRAKLTEFSLVSIALTFSSSFGILWIKTSKLLFHNKYSNVLIVQKCCILNECYDKYWISITCAIVCEVSKKTRSVNVYWDALVAATSLGSYPWNASISVTFATIEMTWNWNQHRNKIYYLWKKTSLFSKYGWLLIYTFSIKSSIYSIWITFFYNFQLFLFLSLFQ